MSEIAKLFFAVSFLALAFVFAPIAAIASWNVLFGGSNPIPLSFETWLSALFFLSVFTVRVRGKR